MYVVFPLMLMKQRIFSYTTKRDRFFITISTFGAIICGLTYPAMTIVFGNLVGHITSTNFTGEDAGQVKTFLTGVINQAVLYFVYLFGIRFVSGYIATLGFNVMSIRVSSTLRLAYMKALLSQRVSLLDTQPPGQLAAIITSTSNALQAGISEKFALLIQSIALVVGAMINAYLHSWKLALVTCSGLLLIILTYCVTTPFVVKNQKQVEQMNIKASGVSSEAFGAMRMIAACGAEGKVVNKYEGWVSKARKIGMRLSKIVAVQKGTVFFSVIGTFAVSCWFAARMIVAGEIPNSSILIMVLMSIMMTINALSNIAQPVAAASRAAHAARTLFNGLDAPKPKTTGKKAPDVSATERLVLWNVNFTYPSRPKQKILDQFKLVIPAGKVTAIVGPSGSGKSTIVSLIERWYELDGAVTGNKLVQYFRNGKVACGGVPLHEIDMKWWRSQIGLVQQEPFLFNDTIYTNVSYGLIGTEWEDAEEEKKRELVKQACAEAFADEFISRLPDGYDTLVGDSGGKLSGGQRQRLAIARAIVKKPKILILDEATSAIDVQGEKVVQAALDKVSQGRTTIVIAHRLSTVKNADTIVVMSKGKVAQWGKHKQLMAKKSGPYYLLSQAQKLTSGESQDAALDNSSDTAVSEDGRCTKDLTGKHKGEEDVRPASETCDDDDDNGNDIEYESKKLTKVFGPLLLEQRKHWIWYCIMFFGAVMAGASAPLQAYLFAALLSSFNTLGPYLLILTNFWCLMFVILAGSVGIGYFALTFAATRIAFMITTSYQLDYFGSMILKPISWFDKEEEKEGTLTQRLAADATALQQLLGNNLAFIVIAILSIAGCLAIAFYFGWKLTAISLAAAMPLAIAAGFFRSRIEKKFQKMNTKVFAESARFATESMGAIRTVTALTLEDTICQRYEKMLTNHLHVAYRKARLATIIFAASDAVPLLCMAFILWYGGGLLVSGEYISFQYLVVYLAVVQGAQGVGQWLSFVPNLGAAKLAAARIQEVRVREIDPDKGLKLGDAALEFNEKHEIMGPEIAFQNVWFKYPTRDVPVLCGMNMTIEKGQFAAIVGPSAGCGKTSIISIIERFYGTKSGQVSMNGVDIRDINIQDYRKTMSLVAQEPFMFQGTIRENILFGVEPEKICSCDHNLHEACRDAEIHDFIMSLPEGYNTRVGFKGILLSGGQKQRMSIARALIRNPRLLLLDEATSALDSETEKLVEGVFERTKKSRTMVVVAHRLATIQNADIIFVLGDGKVVESGTHAQLLAKKGVYWSMCQAQSLE
ncbi:ABC transporter-like protein [Truncatella angustata]|uniref:ABC transporter-like protein n=1 Tax=Truncatella angustata TaxID=152316 RepID=A0A9P8ZWU0_9PEZI|nr:ABC transporter-like protein [Truncatella angustata]KAH6652323.1 ABC transporter-like protein [Truncatella angustata]